MEYKAITYKHYLLIANKINNNEEVNKILLLYVFQKELVWLYSNLNILATKDCLDLYLNLVKKYVAGYPLAYIIKYQWFCNNKFFVDERVLIPRNETEELVKNVLLTAKIIFKYEKLKVLDLGTGSGAIAISLALAQPQWKITASDISDNALTIAKINSKNYNLGNINFIKSNLFANITNKFDIIVCNPPYIDDQASQFINSSLKFEPQLALFTKNKGLYFYQLIFKQCHNFIEKSFLLAFEFGFDQKVALLFLVKQYFSNYHYKFIKDSNNNWRMLFIW